MNKHTKPKIGIIGVGYVGGAVKRWFEKEKYPLFLYDKYKKIGSIEDVNKADIIFICVPTPFTKKKGFDLSYVKDAVSIIKGKKIVVIKSTVWPGTTEMFQKKYPQHKFLFNPEFLVARTAIHDFLNPNRQVIGFTKISKSIARKILKILPKSPYHKIIPSSEAEMVKYFGNTFLSTKVIFANQIYDLCQRLSIDYDIVKAVASHDPRIGSSHLNIFNDGYRGYGGACFPKDMKALLQLARKKGAKLKLLEIVDSINTKLIKHSNIANQQNKL